MKPTKIFMIISTSLFFTWEGLSFAFDGIETLTRVSQYYFSTYVAVAAVLGYILGHMFSPIPWVLKIWQSMVAGFGLLAVVLVMSIFFKQQPPLFWFGLSFVWGMIFWSTDQPWNWFKLKDKWRKK
jgi:hypothetical protein